MREPEARRLPRTASRRTRSTRRPFEVNRPKIEVGSKGWDQSFGKIGDSWYTEIQGAHNTRKVSANDGKTLYYFCLVHPFMQGKIKVVK